MSIAYKLLYLDLQRSNLVNNLVAKGVNASNNEKLDELIPKVLDIQTGSTPSESSFFVSVIPETFSNSSFSFTNTEINL